MRAERVAEIRRQIEAGTYVVSSRRIAERILDQIWGNCPICANG